MLWFLFHTWSFSSPRIRTGLLIFTAFALFVGFAQLYEGLKLRRVIHALWYRSFFGPSQQYWDYPWNHKKLENDFTTSFARVGIFVLIAVFPGLFLFAWFSATPPLHWGVKEIVSTFFLLGWIILFSWLGVCEFRLLKRLRYFGDTFLLLDEFPLSNTSKIELILAGPLVRERLRNAQAVVKLVNETVSPSVTNVAGVSDSKFKLRFTSSFDDKEVIEIKGKVCQRGFSFEIDPTIFGQNSTQLFSMFSPRYWELDVTGEGEAGVYRGLFLLPVYLPPGS